MMDRARSMCAVLWSVPHATRESSHVRAVPRGVSELRLHVSKICSS